MMHKKLLSSAVLFLLLPSLCLAIDTVQINEKDALFSAYDKTSGIISTKYLGWTADWKWANAAVTATHTSQKTYSQDSFGNTSNSPLTGQSINPARTFNNIYQESQFTAEILSMGITFNGSVSPAPPPGKQVNWTSNWNKSIDITDAIGFGIEFILDLTSSSFASTAQDPEILADNKGWRWQTPDGQSIEVTFSPPPAKIYFERNQKNNIRVLFFEGIVAGIEKSTMTVKVSNKVKIVGPESLNYGIENTATWDKDILPATTSPVDLSFLNANDLPAGKHGFIVRDKDQLLFTDGTPAKFWGANMVAYALFTSSDEAIKQHAKRVAEYGYNLIRVHHVDSLWVRPNIFKNPSDNTLELSAASFQKLDWWIKCLKDEGVYLWLDLHVGRTFTKNDGIQYFDDFAKGQDASEAKGYNYYNNSIQSAMQDFNKAYLDHINTHTGLSYKEDPAVIAVLITNENELTHHFGNQLLADKGVPIHNKMFTDDVALFSTTWKLEPKKVAKTWEPGPSKIYLGDVEHRFNKKMQDHLTDLGVKSLVATTHSWGGTGLYSLPSLTDGSIIDSHSYGREGELNYNPRSTPGFLSWIGASQITGYPLSVTEWNIEPFPARDRFTAPIYSASIASLQGWDALMLYGYSQHTLNVHPVGDNYSSHNDPGISGLMPAAALLYRQGHVKPANKSYELSLPRDQFFYNQHSPNTSKAIRTLLETSRLTIAMPLTQELPWLTSHIIPAPSGTTQVSDPDKDFIPAGQNYVTSDTGELKRDWEFGIHTINTPKSQIASGIIGSKKISLDSVDFKIQTNRAVAAVQSLDNKPLAQSKKIFITLMARSKPLSGRTLPFLSEPVIGSLIIKAPVGLNLYTADNQGKLTKQPKPKYTGGRYQVSMTADNHFYWAVLKP